jgi:ADP-heptose:LPS heptosyltransferase
MSSSGPVLVHLAAGIGNIVLATPLLVVLGRHFRAIDLLLDADYAGVDGLFAEWSGLRRIYSSRGREVASVEYGVRVPAIPPFYWPRFAPVYRGLNNVVARPFDALFYHDEQGYYLEFARRLGCSLDPTPNPFLPIAPAPHSDIGPGTLVIAPGCKTGEMAAKRWPYFSQLATMFDDVAVVGTADDLRRRDGVPLHFPPHVRSLVGRLELRRLAELLAGCGTVVANDSGIGHLAAALGCPTFLIFGPTPDRTLGRLGPNVTILRAGLACEPCWFGDRFGSCAGRIACLAGLDPGTVAEAIRRGLGCAPEAGR